MSHDARQHQTVDLSGMPTHGRLLGIDYGTVRIGVAISDPSQSLASPFENYTRRNEQLDAAFFRQIVDQERPVGIIVGLPVHMSGDESEASQKARQFGKWLSEATQLNVVFWDERNTSLEAEQHLIAAQLTKKQRKKRLDMLAAQAILASYLSDESRRPRDQHESM